MITKRYLLNKSILNNFYLQVINKRMIETGNTHF